MVKRRFGICATLALCLAAFACHDGELGGTGSPCGPELRCRPAFVCGADLRCVRATPNDGGAGAPGGPDASIDADVEAADADAAPPSRDGTPDGPQGPGRGEVGDARVAQATDLRTEGGDVAPPPPRGEDAGRLPPGLPPGLPPQRSGGFHVVTVGVNAQGVPNKLWHHQATVGRRGDLSALWKPAEIQEQTGAPGPVAELELQGAEPALHLFVRSPEGVVQGASLVGATWGRFAPVARDVQAFGAARVGTTLWACYLDSAGQLHLRVGDRLEPQADVGLGALAKSLAGAIGAFQATKIDCVGVRDELHVFVADSGRRIWHAAWTPTSQRLFERVRFEAPDAITDVDVTANFDELQILVATAGKQYSATLQPVDPLDPAGKSAWSPFVDLDYTWDGANPVELGPVKGSALASHLSEMLLLRLDAARQPVYLYLFRFALTGPPLLPFKYAELLGPQSHIAASNLH